MHSARMPVQRWGRCIRLQESHNRACCRRPPRAASAACTTARVNPTSSFSTTALRIWTACGLDLLTNSPPSAVNRAASILPPAIFCRTCLPSTTIPTGRIPCKSSFEFSARLISMRVVREFIPSWSKLTYPRALVLNFAGSSLNPVARTVPCLVEHRRGAYAELHNRIGSDFVEVVSYRRTICCAPDCKNGSDPGFCIACEELRDNWRNYIRGWWEYYQLAEDRAAIFRLEGWIRRHIRKCFWLRWHSKQGRERKLRGLGLTGLLLKVAASGRGAWRIARTGSLRKALSNAVLRLRGFVMPSDLAAAVGR